MAKKETGEKQVSVPERHFGVVLEDINSKLDLVVEGVGVLDRKIDKNHEEFKEFRKEVNYKFEVVFEKFASVESELHIIRNDLKEKIGRDEFLFLEKRVTALERPKPTTSNL